VPVCIFAFIAAHAVGQGAVIWYSSRNLSEPSSGRGPDAGEFNPLGVCRVLTIFSQLVSAFPPAMVHIFRRHDGVQIGLGGAHGAETKGVPLEDMAARLEGNGMSQLTRKPGKP